MPQRKPSSAPALPAMTDAASVFQGLPVATLFAGCDLQILQCNAAAEQLLGSLEAGELSVLSHLHPALHGLEARLKGTRPRPG